MLLLLLLGSCLGLAGCRREEKPRVLPDGTYRIYYLNQTRTKLTSVEYETDTTDPELLLEELGGQLEQVPENPDYQELLEENVELLGFRQEENILYLDFNKEYSSMKPSREILCRAALAKTFTQVSGVDYISIFCDGQPLMDSNGSPVGAVAGTDFVESISDVNSYEWVELKLYFANGTKDGLQAETREVIHNVNTSMERLIVEQLLAGSQAGGNPVLPKETRILNVSMTENTCYVNLDSGFLNGDLEAAEYIPIYALVNSLTELQTVNKVQITVNGSADILYRNAISLASPLERDEQYLAKE